jgi:hypothetical protein
MGAERQRRLVAQLAQHLFGLQGERMSVRARQDEVHERGDGVLLARGGQRRAGPARQTRVRDLWLEEEVDSTAPPRGNGAVGADPRGETVVHEDDAAVRINQDVAGMYVTVQNIQGVQVRVGGDNLFGQVEKGGDALGAAESTGHRRGGVNVHAGDPGRDEVRTPQMLPRPERTWAVTVVEGTQNRCFMKQQGRGLRFGAVSKDLQRDG